MRTMIVGVHYPAIHAVFEMMMQELKELALALNIEVQYSFVQNLPVPDKQTYLGSGKVSELRQFIQTEAIDLVLFNEELTSVQYLYFQDQLDCAIEDRTSLILRIFEQRARSREAILQVGIARLKYTLPRLVGAHRELTGQQGGSGFRGSGETQLENDRRLLHQKLQRYEKELRQIAKERQTQRDKRKKSDLPIVALVGYTNSGKSTLLNALVDEKKVFEKDMLFATLQTATRYCETDDHLPFLLTDTVGFISFLPHELIQAFRSTLEEIREADLIIQVIDVSHPEYTKHIETTEQVLESLGVKDIPMLYVYNKIDKGNIVFLQTREPHLLISAKEKTNLDQLKRFLGKTLFGNLERYQLWIPYAQGETFAMIMRHVHVKEVQYQENGIYMDIETLPSFKKKLESFIILN